MSSEDWETESLPKPKRQARRNKRQARRKKRQAWF